jgi:hypothetical protein
MTSIASNLCFDSWDALMAFIIEGLELEVPDTG